MPAATGDGAPVPVVVLIHGGFWRGRLGKVLMRPLARSVVDHGWAAWNIEYRRTGAFGGGGGWPDTLADVGAAVDALATQPGLDLSRVVSCGHSAGGHLALWLGARPKLAAPLGGGVAVPVTGAVALAGIPDLRTAFELDLGKGAVGALLGGGPDTVPDRYRDASPIEQLPLGIPQVLVHGLDDTAVPASLSERYVERATAAGDDARAVPLAGVTHRDMLRAAGPGWTAALDHLGRLLGSAPTP
jgi:acetyl esterase/lipase